MAFKVTSTHISKNLTINSNVKDKFKKQRIFIKMELD